MPLKIITAEERLAQANNIKGVISGPSGVGKTSLLRTLDPATTLGLDLEAGLLAVEDWAGDSISVRQQAQAMGITAWDFCRHMAAMIGGPDPSRRADEMYSQQHYDYACSLFGGSREDLLGKYETIFVDSITVAGRYSLHFANGHPDATTKQGKRDARAAYGIHGQEMIGWLTQIQHTPDKNVWLVGILQEREDDYGRRTWSMQIDGSKASLELPGIMDEVISMVIMDDGQNQPYRAFVTHLDNPWGYPAKDRSGRLELLEPPDLGALMRKIKGGSRLDQQLTTSMPEGDPISHALGVGNVATDPNA